VKYKILLKIMSFNQDILYGLFYFILTKKLNLLLYFLCWSMCLLLNICIFKVLLQKKRFIYFAFKKNKYFIYKTNN